MTTRASGPIPTVVVYGASGGVGTTTVAAAMAMLTQAGHDRGHTVLVDFDSRAFDVFGQPPYSDMSEPGATHHLGVHPGIDVVCWPGARFDPMTLPGVLAADPRPAGVNAVIVDAATPSPAAVGALGRHQPAARTVLVTASTYPAASAARDHVAASGAHPDEIVVVDDASRAFGVAHFATWWPEGTQLRVLRRDPAVAEVVDAGLFGLASRPGERIFPHALAELQGSAALCDSADRRRLWEALHASRPDSAAAVRQMREWTRQIEGDLGAATAAVPANGNSLRDGCAVCGVEGPGHDPGCPARTAVPAHRALSAVSGSRNGLSIV